MVKTWPAVPDSVPEICQWVYDTARSAGFPKGEAERWELALEEVAINIVRYAYGDGPVGTIEIEVRLASSGMSVQISDTGQSFNPLAAPEPKIGAALEEREIGGLGIYLARKVVDRVQYERRDGKNILTLSKQLSLY
jgi:anti-sigma regulatory factor (Ser/Thr protein kinase)